MKTMRLVKTLLWPLLTGIWFCGITVCATDNDPVVSLRRFSAFHDINIAKLLGGDILAERDSLMNFPNGIATQCCFAIPSTPEQTAKELQTWNPAPHEALKVYSYVQMHSPPNARDFEGLNFKSSKRAIRWLFDCTRGTTAKSSQLNLSQHEATQIAQSAKNSTADASTIWSKILLARTQAFYSKSFAGIAPYEMGSEAIAPSLQLRTMLRERHGVTQEFAPILEQIGLLGGAGTSGIQPFYYWTLLDANSYGTISLGAVYLLKVADHYQIADIEYYVSSNYYTSATLFEIWPVQSGSKTGSLVWRGDYFAAPTLAYTKGIERVTYGALMLLDVKRSVQFFEQDLKHKLNNLQ